MFTEVLFLVSCIAALLAGVSLGLFLYAESDRRKREHRVYNCEDFCFDCCKIHEKYYSEHDDPDDAWNALDGSHECEGCPIYIAQDILSDIQIEKWRKKHKK